MALSQEINERPGMFYPCKQSITFIEGKVNLPVLSRRAATAVMLESASSFQTGVRELSTNAHHCVL